MTIYDNMICVFLPKCVFSTGRALHVHGNCVQVCHLGCCQCFVGRLRSMRWEHTNVLKIDDTKGSGVSMFHHSYYLMYLPDSSYLRHTWYLTTSRLWQSMDMLLTWAALAIFVASCGEYPRWAAAWMVEYNGINHLLIQTDLSSCHTGAKGREFVCFILF